mgnify:CR=1 FL=1
MSTDEARRVLQPVETAYRLCAATIAELRCDLAVGHTGPHRTILMTISVWWEMLPTLVGQCEGCGREEIETERRRTRRRYGLPSRHNPEGGAS